MAEKGQRLPKLGEWDVKKPATAEGFTVIFSKARDHKKSSKMSSTSNPAAQLMTTNTNACVDVANRHYSIDDTRGKWLCCCCCSRC